MNAQTLTEDDIPVGEIYEGNKVKAKYGKDKDGVTDVELCYVKDDATKTITVTHKLFRTDEVHPNYKDATKTEARYTYNKIEIPEKVKIKIGEEYQVYTVTKIGNYAFFQNNKDKNGDKYLSYVKIPNSITIIGNDAFCDDIDLEEIDLDPKGSELREIQELAFCKVGCAVFDIPYKCHKLGQNAFMGFGKTATDKLKTVKIHSTITEMDANVFYCCSNLTDIYVYSISPADLELRGGAYNNMFPNTTKIHVPCVVEQAYKDAEGWKNWASQIDGTLPYSEDEEEFEKDLANVIHHTHISNCDCDDFKNALKNITRITIGNEGSLSFSDDEQYSKAMALLSGKTVVLKKTLHNEQWNLVGNMGNASSYGDLLANNVDENGKRHDMAVVEWDYDANDWTDFKYANDKPKSHQSFLVWPFNNEWESDITAETAKIDGVNKTTLSVEVDPANLGEKDVTYDGFGTLTNNGVAYTNKDDGWNEGKSEGIAPAYWFALYNPFIGRMSVNRFIRNNHKDETDHFGNAGQDVMQGKYIYVYDTIGGKWKYIGLHITAGIQGGTDQSLKDTVIRPNSGFMIAGANETITPIFRRSQVFVKAETEKAYKAGKEPIGIYFTTYANGTQRSAIVHYDENSSNGFDRNDAFIMISDNNTDLVEPYFVVDRRQIFDNYVASLPYETEMRFHAGKQSPTELIVTNIPANVSVSIVDMQTDTETQLIDGEKYSFVVEEGENVGRYKVKFYNSGVSIQDAEDSFADVRFMQNNRNVTVFGDGLQSAEVVNTLGQVIKNKRLSGNEATINIDGNGGVYIVKVKTQNGTATQKFVVK